MSTNSVLTYLWWRWHKSLKLDCLWTSLVQPKLARSWNFHKKVSPKMTQNTTKFVHCFSLSGVSGNDDFTFLVYTFLLVTTAVNRICFKISVFKMSQNQINISMLMLLINQNAYQHCVAPHVVLWFNSTATLLKLSRWLRVKEIMNWYCTEIRSEVWDEEWDEAMKRVRKCTEPN